MSGSEKGKPMQFWLVLAPTGEPLRWTASWSEEGAIRNLLGDFVKLWDFAQRQGYVLVFQNGT